MYGDMYSYSNVVLMGSGYNQFGSFTKMIVDLQGQEGVDFPAIEALLVT